MPAKVKNSARIFIAANFLALFFTLTLIKRPFLSYCSRLFTFFVLTDSSPGYQTHHRYHAFFSKFAAFLLTDLKHYIVRYYFVFGTK